MTIELSATRVQAFDDTTPFGCQRRWHMQYIQKLPTPDVPHLALGTALHKRMEHFLTDQPQPDGEVAFDLYSALVPIAEQARHFGVIGVEKHFVFEPHPGMRFTGTIDALLGQDGVPSNILDWKTSSNIERYATPSSGLDSNIQLNLYALHVMQEYNVASLQCSLAYVQSKPPHKTKISTTEITKESATDFFATVIQPLAQKMLHAGQHEDHTQLEFTKDKRKCYRCPFNNVCEKNMKSFLADILGDDMTTENTPEPPTELAEEVPAGIESPETVAIKRGRGRPKKGVSTVSEPSSNAVITTPTNTTVTKITNVTVGHKLTLNLGNYNSVSVDLSLTAETTDHPRTIDELEAEVRNRLQAMLDKYNSK